MVVVALHDTQSENAFTLQKHSPQYLYLGLDASICPLVIEECPPASQWRLLSLLL